MTDVDDTSIVRDYLLGATPKGSQNLSDALEALDRITAGQPEPGWGANTAAWVAGLAGWLLLAAAAFIAAGLATRAAIWMIP